MILMINCSYKGKSSNSRYFLERLQLPCEILDLKDILSGSLDDFIAKLDTTDALVFGTPLYVDGLPAQVVHLLECLMEEKCPKLVGLPVYVVSNLGFYEPQQIQHLLSMVEHWSGRVGAVYGGGIAVGAGPLVRAVDQMPVAGLLNGNVNKAFDSLKNAIANGSSIGNIYCKSLVPRWGYLMAAHKMFNSEIEKNTK